MYHRFIWVVVFFFFLLSSCSSGILSLYKPRSSSVPVAQLPSQAKEPGKNATKVPESKTKETAAAQKAATAKENVPAIIEAKPPASSLPAESKAATALKMPAPPAETKAPATLSMRSQQVEQKDSESKTSEAKPPEPKVAEYKPEEYRIQVGDKLDVKFFYNQDLNTSASVRPDGRISLPLVGEMMVTGLTPSEITKVLIDRYQTKISRPEITVIVQSFTAPRIYVMGEVMIPGMLPLSAGLSLFQAVAARGGFKETARPEQVIVIRRLPGKKPIAIAVNTEKIMDGTDMGQDILMIPQDIVYVPKSSIANVNQWVDQYIRKNIPIGVGATAVYELDRRTPTY
ncbi:MAG: polysaccharide export protein [Smithellaceae bacterium]|nr:polysaccharide export protein [Smithellaceae bacterium]